ncbi:MAG: AraC family transcriptional regulator [Bacillota bacterium]|nr:MAG: AraC family transcriptional regulator [Bacillota bacterium]
MEGLRSRVAYLSGLVEGLAIEDGSAQGRVLAEMVGILGEMAEAIDEVREAQEELAGYIDEVDEDLTDLAGDLYLPDGEEEDDDEDDDDAGLAKLHCPNCGQLLALAAGVLADQNQGMSVVCPGCGTLVGVVAEED